MPVFSIKRLLVIVGFIYEWLWMLLYRLFRCEKFLLHKPYCVFDAWYSLILAKALWSIWVVDLSFYLVFLRDLVCKVVYFRLYELLGSFLVICRHRSIFWQDLNSPLDFVLLFGLFKFFYKVLRLFDVSFRIGEFIVILLVLWIIVGLAIVFNIFLLYLFFVSDHFSQVSMIVVKCTFLSEDLCQYFWKSKQFRIFCGSTNRWCQVLIFFFFTVASGGPPTGA